MNNNIQKYMYWLLLVFLAVGFFYPPIGLIAIICMVAPVSVAFYKGRFWCGNFCPRGSFYDHVLAKISPKKSIPPIFKSSGLRVFMVLFIITVFSIQIYATWGDLYAMGTVFVRLILITTLVGIILGIFYNQRTWCAFCPMGTLASWISSSKKNMTLMVSDACVKCKRCEKVCPMQLKPYTAKGKAEGFDHSDCLKCGRCVANCPKNALKFK
ncbi:MAG: 4Fe-4S binding protein [Veillonella sp.]|jgi:polyferredoxin|nr:4Fe-4S binding protein [Acidaminococcus hominis]MBK7921474.1 4Fe-4S binding protein [Veillonella sp.]MBP9970618.1 4Fe-4S binding protein [Paludibacteraceae bacterium]MCD2434631.1 4Fe-4S binding protein [Acidaminococcus hominis]